MTKNILKYIFILIYIFSFQLTGYGQTDDKVKFGFCLFPGISYKVNPINYSEYQPGWYIKELPNRDMPKLSYSLGLQFAYYFSNRSAIESGAYFIDRSYNTPIFICLGDNCARQATAIHYIDIPVSYQYTFIKKAKYKFFFSLGMGASIFIAEKNSLIYGLSPDKESAYVILENNYYPVRPSVFGAVKASIRLSDNLVMEVGPRFQLGLNSFTKERDFINSSGKEVPIGSLKYTYQPYYIGLEVSLMRQKQVKVN